MHWQIFQKAGSDDFVCSCFYCCHNDLLQHSYQHPKVCGEHFFLWRHNKSAENSWQGLRSFDLPEETLDKCHDFVVQRNKEGRACLQYKHKRVLMPFCLLNLMLEVPITLQPMALVQSYNAHQRKMSSQRKNSGITLSGMSPTTLYLLKQSKDPVLQSVPLWCFLMLEKGIQRCQQSFQQPNLLVLLMFVWACRNLGSMK